MCRPVLLGVRLTRRRVKGCALDVHPTEKALIVQYEVEATVLGEKGYPMVGERKECQKMWEFYTEWTILNWFCLFLCHDASLFPSFSPGFAWKAWTPTQTHPLWPGRWWRNVGWFTRPNSKRSSSCSSICRTANGQTVQKSFSHVRNVPQTFFFHQRLLCVFSSDNQETKRVSPRDFTAYAGVEVGAERCSSGPWWELQCVRRCFLSLQLDEEVSISSIDEYVELLYEGIQEKIRGATLIFLLARNPDNLEELVQNGTSPPKILFCSLQKLR